MFSFASSSIFLNDLFSILLLGDVVDDDNDDDDGGGDTDTSLSELTLLLVLLLRLLLLILRPNLYANNVVIATATRIGFCPLIRNDRRYRHAPYLFHKNKIIM